MWLLNARAMPSPSLSVARVASVALVALAVASALAAAQSESSSQGGSEAFTATPPPPTTRFIDRRAVLLVVTPFPPTGGTVTFIDPPPATARWGQFMNISNMSQHVANILRSDPLRIDIRESETWFNATAVSRVNGVNIVGLTNFTIHFLEPFAATTTTAGGEEIFTDPPSETPPPAPGVTVTTGTTRRTTTAAPVLSALVLGFNFRRGLISRGAGYLSPFILTNPAVFFDVPRETAAPPTLEYFTPVPTIPEDSGNVTSFNDGAADSVQIVAISISVVIGVLLLGGGVVFVKGYMDNKLVENKPSGFKYAGKV